MLLLRAALPALIAALLPLGAASTEAGVQGGLLFPQNDLRRATDGRIGFAIGVHGAVNLTNGNELRGRIDYLRVDAGAYHVGSLSGSTWAHCGALGADLIRFVEGRPRGLYGLAGGGLQWWSSSTAQGRDHKTFPYLQAGVGNRFNAQVGMEFTYQLTRFRSSAGTAGNFQAAVTWRF